MNILLSNVHHALKCTFFGHFWTFFQKKLQIFEKMPNLPQNENFAHKCTSLLSNVHFLTFKKKHQIFEKMPNLPQNEHFAHKCTSLLSNVHF